MKVTLAIIFDQATGQIGATGPLDNAGLCYMMLEMARDLVHDRRSVARTGLVAAKTLSNGKDA